MNVDREKTESCSAVLWSFSRKDCFLESLDRNHDVLD